MGIMDKEQVRWLGDWLKIMADRQEAQIKLLDKINDKLGLFIIIILSIVVSALSMCGGSLLGN